MNNRNNKMELLGNAPIPKALMAMGIPTMLGMMVNAIYNLVDAYFVGSLGTSQMGAISVVYPLGQVVVGLGLLFGNGSASYLSRLLGKGDKEKANQVASTALYSSITVGAIMIILSIIFLRPILKFLGATDSIMPYAITYASIYIISCIFNVFNVTMNDIVTGKNNYVCLNDWCNIEYWFRPCIHLYIKYGCCRSGNRNCYFTDCFYISLFNIYS